MVTFISHSDTETRALGETWGRSAQQGLVIALCGELGAGKTQLVKGVALGLGVTARVHSPTFTLLNIYRGGRLPLFHIDLYRLETHNQVTDAGLEEYFQPDGVAVIEWADRWFVPVGTPLLDSKNLSRQTGKPSFDAIRTGKLCFTEQILPAHFRWVVIESISETQRRILHEDFGA